MASRIDGPREARAASTALRAIDAETRKQVNKQTRAVVNPAWQSEVKSRTRTKQDDLILAKGTRVNVGARPVLTAANSGKALRGGLVPNQVWAKWEFGSSKRDLRKTYTGRSPKGKQYKVTRRTSQQMPPRIGKGRVLYPAVSDTGPRVYALYTQTTIRAIYDALKKGE